MAESPRLFEEVDVCFGKLKLAVADVSDDLALCWLCVLYVSTIHLTSEFRGDKEGAACAWGRRCIEYNLMERDSQA